MRSHLEHDGSADVKSADSYKELAMMSSVLKEVVEDLRGKGFDSQNQLHPETLRRMVKLETTESKIDKMKIAAEPVDPFIMILKVKGNDPTFITETANTLAHFWVEEGKKLQENFSKVNQALIQENKNLEKNKQQKERKLMEIQRLTGFKRQYGDVKRAIENNLLQTRSLLAELRNGIGFLQKQIKDTPQEEAVPGEFPTLAVKLEYLLKSELLHTRIRKEKLNGKEKFLKGSLEEFSAEISVLEKKIEDKHKEKLIKDVKLDKNALKEGLDAVSTPLRKPEQFEEIKILSKAIEPNIPIWPDKFKISYGYPNPFNPIVNFNIDIPIVSNIQINVYNLLGAEIDNINRGNRRYYPGSYNFYWNASQFNSGIYFVRFKYDNNLYVKKITLIK